MSELVEFTAAEMKGVPTFNITCNEIFIGVEGMHSVTHTFYTYGDLEEEAFYYTGRKKLLCNPIDRMNAIARHLFELMPHMETIKTNNNFVHIDNDGNEHLFCCVIYNEEDYYSKTGIDINPFLHTDRTEITREELGL